MADLVEILRSRSLRRQATLLSVAPDTYGLALCNPKWSKQVCNAVGEQAYRELTIRYGNEISLGQIFKQGLRTFSPRGMQLQPLTLSIDSTLTQEKLESAREKAGVLEECALKVVDAIYTEVGVRTKSSPRLLHSIYKDMDIGSYGRRQLRDSFRSSLGASLRRSNITLQQLQTATDEIGTSVNRLHVKSNLKDFAELLGAVPSSDQEDQQLVECMIRGEATLLSNDRFSKAFERYAINVKKNTRSRVRTLGLSHIDSIQRSQRELPLLSDEDIFLTHNVWQSYEDTTHEIDEQKPPLSELLKSPLAFRRFFIENYNEQMEDYHNIQKGIAQILDWGKHNEPARP